MIEETIRSFLEQKLDPIPVHMEVPADKPARFVVIEKTGSDENDGLCTADIAVQSYGPTMYEAARLNRAAIKAMKELTELPEVTRAEKETDYNFTDTAMKRYRYQAVFHIYHYEEDE